VQDDPENQNAATLKELADGIAKLNLVLNTITADLRKLADFTSSLTNNVDEIKNATDKSGEASEKILAYLRDSRPHATVISISNFSHDKKTADGLCEALFANPDVHSKTIAAVGFTPAVDKRVGQDTGIVTQAKQGSVSQLICQLSID